MEISNKSLATLGVVLVVLGLLFLVLNFLPGWSIGKAWPVIFFFLAALFFVPPFLFPSQRQWIGSLFIPGAILISLGVLFFYNTLTGDWKSWAYGWLLIIAGIGLGLLLAGWYGKWGRAVTLTGIWMIVVNLGLFALFGAIFGGPVLKAAAPVLLTLAGVLLLVRAFRR